MPLIDLVYPADPAPDGSDLSRCHAEMRRQIAYGEAFCREQAAFRAVMFWRQFRERMAPWMTRMHPSSAAVFGERLADAEDAAIAEHQAAERAFLAIGSRDDLDVERGLARRRACPHHASDECPA